MQQHRGSQEPPQLGILITAAVRSWNRGGSGSSTGGFGENCTMVEFAGSHVRNGSLILAPSCARSLAGVLLVPFRRPPRKCAATALLGYWPHLGLRTCLG